jgi:hypothetical protein
MLTVHYQISVNPHSAHEQVHLSAEQLWSGLLLRIVEPERFTIGLDRAEVAQISDVRYQRTLFFGEHAIRDEVVLTPQHSVRFTTEATDTVPSGQLYYEIQNDPMQGLMLHCEYATNFPEPNTDEDRSLLEAVKNAYRMIDEDMVRLIREYALMVRH